MPSRVVPSSVTVQPLPACNVSTGAFHQLAETGPKALSKGQKCESGPHLWWQDVPKGRGHGGKGYSRSHQPNSLADGISTGFFCWNVWDGLLPLGQDGLSVILKNHQPHVHLKQQLLFSKYASNPDQLSLTRAANQEFSTAGFYYYLQKNTPFPTRLSPHLKLTKA